MRTINISLKIGSSDGVGERERNMNEELQSHQSQKSKKRRLRMEKVMLMVDKMWRMKKISSLKERLA